jgi:hypothetical protein
MRFVNLRVGEILFIVLSPDVLKVCFCYANSARTVGKYQKEIGARS